MPARIPFDPLSRRKPDLFGRQTACLVDGRGYGRHDHVIAKHVFVLRRIGLLGFRPVVIKRTQESDAGVVGATGFGVDVGNKRVTKVKLITHDVRVRFGISPDTSFRIGILGCVRAQDRTEGAELDPACVQLRIDRARHMAANVVTPVRIADVRCRGGEPRLKGERVPN